MIFSGRPKTRTPNPFVLLRVFLFGAFATCMVSGCGLTSHSSIPTGTATPQSDRQLYLTGRFIGDSGNPFDGLCAFRLSDGLQQRCTGIPITIPSAPAANSGVLFTRWEQQTIAAVRLTTASPIWQLQLPQPLTFDPVLAGDTIYCITGAAKFAPPSGWLYALNAQDGSVRWRVQTEIPPGPLVVSHDTVYLSTQDQTSESGGGEGVVYALRTSDGARLWRLPTSRSWDAALAIAPNTATANTLYLTSDAQTIEARRLSDHTLLWRYHDQTEFGSLLLVDDTVFATARNRQLYAFDAQTGTLRWHQPAWSRYQSPMVMGDAVYTSDIQADSQNANSDDNAIAAFQALTGQELWRRQLGGSVGGLTLDGDVLYVVSVVNAPNPEGLPVYGCLYTMLNALSSATGATRWSHQLHGCVTGRALIA
jgi:outer membrane protein assembly factor BamB